MTTVQAATRTASSPSAEPPASQAFARAGDTVDTVATRLGVDPAALRAANPDLPNPDFLLDGQSLQLPAPAAAGVAGAMGREAAVDGLMKRAYDAGHGAPQEAFRGEVFRTVGQPAYEATAFDGRHGNPGRYNAPTERVFYTSPDAASSQGEMHAYGKPGSHPMAGTSMVRAEFTATPDAHGRGGVADLREGLARQGLPPETVSHPKGQKAPSALHLLTGEHPYSLSQQAAKGAADAGASAVRAPSAVGVADQVDIIPRNTDPSQVRPLDVVRFDDKGRPGPAQPAGHVQPMEQSTTRPSPAGPLDKGAGRTGPDAAHQRAAEPAPKGSLEHHVQRATGATEGYPRANSGRYGAVGGAVVSLGNDAVAAVRGQPVDLAGSATAAGGHAAVGYGAARAADALTPRVGLRGAGGAVAGAIESVVSTGTNTQAYRRGEISAARASANIAVDTGSAVAAGAAGAAVGAAVGSVVPVAGTAAGAVVGFAAGAVTYGVVQWAGRASGAIDAAKDRLAVALAGAEQPLGRALDKVGEGLDAASRAASSVWNAVKPW